MDFSEISNNAELKDDYEILVQRSNNENIVKFMIYGDDF